MAILGGQFTIFGSMSQDQTEVLRVETFSCLVPARFCDESSMKAGRNWGIGGTVTK